MINPEITLIKKTFTIDSIGNQVATETQTTVPIIRMNNIYANEFYKAAQSGYKPTLRLVISVLNYNDENEFVYNNKDYSIIRTENLNMDELILIAERKVKDVG